MQKTMGTNRWGIDIPQSASAAYNAIRKRWVEQSATLEAAHANAKCECENCGASLVGEDVFATVHDWRCRTCMECGLEDNMDVTRIISAIEKAQTSWTDCDWAHERRPAERDEYDIPVYCDGGDDTCEYCRGATEAAESAQSYGDDAIKALREGRLDAVRDAIDHAVACEDQWGDAPVWRPIQNLVKVNDYL